MTKDPIDVFAVTAPGLEATCAAELQAHGVAGRVEPGGVAWRGDLASVYRANLGLRTASRVLVRLGEFRARTFHELERHSARQSWPWYVASGARVALRVTSRKSKLYHEGAIAERIARVLQDSFGLCASLMKGEEESERGGAEAQLVVVRFLRDVCTISVDSSGRLLHQRGYRQALAKAPLRETTAAALLLATRWDPRTPLLDPFCGSGTIPIEAALLARRIAPGLANPSHEPRGYACLQWPRSEPDIWADVVAAARGEIVERSEAAVFGSDRNGGAIAASVANAGRAGVAADVTFEQRPLSALDPPPARGHLVTNPPYGVRVGDAEQLQTLYAALGRVVRDKLSGWTVALLAAEPRLAAATGLPLRPVLATRNGGINVQLLAADIDSRVKEDL